MKPSKQVIVKADATSEVEARLTEMDVEFVSLVRAGANRQTKFMVVKQEDGGEVEEVKPVEDANQGDSETGTAEEVATDKTDTSDWLRNYEDKIDGLLTNSLLEMSIEDPAPEAPIVPASTTEEVSDLDGNEGEPGTPVTATDSEPLKAEVEALKNEVGDLRSQTEDLKVKLTQAKGALNKERARVVSLKSTVGSTTAIQTGVTSVSKKEVEKKSNEKTVWTTDLAAEAVESKS